MIILKYQLPMIILLPMQSVHVYHYCVLEYRSGQGVQHYVIKFVSDLRQVGGFIRVLRLPPPIKLTSTI